MGGQSLATHPRRLARQFQASGKFSACYFPKPVKERIVRIVDFQPIYYDGGQNIARFSIDVSPALKLTGFRLRRRRDGGHSIAAPAAFGVRVAHFDPETFKALTAEAVAEFARHGAQHARN